MKRITLLVMMIGILCLTACGSKSDVVDDPIIDEEADTIGVGTGLSIEDFLSGFEGLVVIRENGNAEQVSWDNRAGLPNEQDGEYYIVASCTEISKSKDSLACFNNTGDGRTVALMPTSDRVGYSYTYKYDEISSTSAIDISADNVDSINGVDVSSSGGNADQINSLLSNEGITIYVDDVYHDISFKTDEPMEIEIKYHQGTQTYTESIFTDLEVVRAVQGTEDITLPMTLSDDGYGIVDISSLSNGYYLYDGDNWTPADDCLIKVVD